MNNERLKEIKDIMFTPHLDMYLPNVCNELFQYVIKQKEILNKIKEKVDYIYKKGNCNIKDVLELQKILEEIE